MIATPICANDGTGALSTITASINEDKAASDAANRGRRKRICMAFPLAVIPHLARYRRNIQTAKFLFADDLRRPFRGARLSQIQSLGEAEGETPVDAERNVLVFRDVSHGARGLAGDRVSLLTRAPLGKNA